ncbi:MAG: hypothetical protein OXH65_00805, partial [Paracoccaceae bacterium]|nr:hypothetical protein [Paracoccaceae bacterium]
MPMEISFVVFGYRHFQTIKQDALATLLRPVFVLVYILSIIWEMSIDRFPTIKQMLGRNQEYAYLRNITYLAQLEDEQIE